MDGLVKFGTLKIGDRFFYADEVFQKTENKKQVQNFGLREVNCVSIDTGIKLNIQDYYKVKRDIL